MALKQESASKCFDGEQMVYSHSSEVLDCGMKFGIYLPPGASTDKPVPVLYYLSGLTCTEQNVITKAGAQQFCAAQGIALVCPDTSPRGVPIEGDSDHWSFGQGAGYYLTATKEPWSKHYNMYDYVTKELPELVQKNFPVTKDMSIMGHSMGGHGALICSLKNPGKYHSVSAISPICNPSETPLQEKAWSSFLATKEEWAQWDACKLAPTYDGPSMEILIDQGTNDSFYKDNGLRPQKFVEATRENINVSAILRMHEGYDHGYYFIASFIRDHIEMHAAALKGGDEE